MPEDNLARIPEAAPSMKDIQRMMMVAQMRATADNNGMGFIGGYMDEETGQVFYQTNIDQEDVPVNDFLRSVLPANAQLPEQR